MEYNIHDISNWKSVIKTLINSGFKKNEEEGWELLIHLSDISKSSKIITDHIIPKLLQQDLNKDNLEDIIFDLRFELQHILYHVKNCKELSEIVNMDYYSNDE